jgi:predicted nucleic acid-binding protein
MTLVDSSIWIDHLRAPNGILTALVERRDVLIHPFVIGEIALGSIRSRTSVLGVLAKLPAIPLATHADVMRLIESRRLFGRGVGYVDAHLLSAALLRRDTVLWTRDRRLDAASEELGIAARFTH